MSFWITLLAAAELPFAVKSLLTMVAVYAFSMGLTWQQFGYLPYAIPIATGVILVIVTWVRRIHLTSFLFHVKYELQKK